MRLLAPAIVLACCATVSAATPRHKPLSGENMPDSLEMLDGTRIHGLIVKNTARNVVIQTKDAERDIPKSEIRRIHDEMHADVVFPEIMAPGHLPSWRAMVYDLRNHDSIHKLQQIPATTVETGFLKNVPYLSFRINEQSEFNVYGNPDDPVAIEFGMYGKQRKSGKYHRIVREFLSGHLQTKEQIAALYSLSFAGDERKVGPLALKITPPGEADAYGGWWITLFNPSRIPAARVSDEKYAQVTRPFEEINYANGRVREDGIRKNENWMASMVARMTGAIPKVRGFYRDKDGAFRFISFNEP